MRTANITMGYASEIARHSATVKSLALWRAISDRAREVKSKPRERHERTACPNFDGATTYTREAATYFVSGKKSGVDAT